MCVSYVVVVLVKREEDDSSIRFLVVQVVRQEGSCPDTNPPG
jgi:hypothetical protein